MAIHSSSVGAGPTIVFVHGWTCDSSSWTGQVPAFAKDHRVITIDLPGHGRSASPRDGKLSMDLFARAVEAVRAEAGAGAERIVLVGHSMGAPVIRQYAHLYPQHVAGLDAVDGPLDLRAFAERPPGFPPPLTGPEGRAAREGMIRSMFIAETPAALQEKILTMMLAAPEATAVGAMNAMFDPAVQWTDVVSAPALSVYAGTANVPDAAATKELYPNHDATQVPGTGHFLMMEKPDEFNRVLAGFLDKIDF
jgi:pimeloyl-ACP methyl ester carboxylesterase